MFRRIGLLLLPVVFVVALTLPGCTTGSTSDSNLTMVSATEADKLVAGKRNLLGLGGETSGVWVDPRSESDYRAGHIPGAISLPFERVSLEHKKLRGYEVLVVYGNDYDDPRAKAMSKRLIELGYRNVNTLIGGLRAWQADGNPLEKSSP